MPALRSRVCAPLRLALFVMLLSASVGAAEFPSGAPSAYGFSAPRLARIHQVIKTEIDANRMPGAVVLVARKGVITHAQAIGFQDKAAGKLLQRDAIFRAYSMTKPLVSVLTMMMVEEGKLQLADPVSKYLPVMSNMQVLANPADPHGATVAAARQITVHDLLRHTSGLTYAEFTRYPSMRTAYEKVDLFSTEVPFKSMMITPSQQIEAFSKAPLLWQPGTTWEYGLSTDLLGRVLEVIGNKPLHEMLNEKLIQPLGMKDTSFVVPPSRIARLAEPLPIDPNTGGPMAKMLDVGKEMGNDSGGAGISTTADDYLRFCQMLLNGGTFEGKRYLSRTTVALMTADHLGPKVATPIQPGELLMGVQGYTFGLGFMVRQGAGLASVPGSEGDYAWAGWGGTFFWIDPKEQLIGILMTQTPGAIRQSYRRMIKQMVYQALE